MSTDTARRFVFNGPTMGTRWAVVFFATAAPEGELVAALQAAVDAVDDTMSTWKPASDLMRLNKTPPGAWLTVAPQLCSVVALGLQIGQASRGAFDIGVGAAVQAWGFGAARSLPDDEAIEDALNRRAKSAAAIEVDLAGSRLRRIENVQLDLSGIAKGYGVDCLAEVLLGQGISNFIVSIDGEIRARGSRPDRTGWVVGLERPDRGLRGLARTIEVSDVAMATSGDYRHWHTHGGEIVSHTIDPQSGMPLRGNLCAVTVTAEHCAVADAWATALMVLGQDKGPQVAEELGLDALFTIRGQHGLQEIGVGAFATLPNASSGER